MKNCISFWCSVLLICALQNNLVAQTNDSLQVTPTSDIVKKICRIFKKDKYGKNIIRYNPTPTLILSDQTSFTLGYERVLKRNQSFSVNFGYMRFPAFFDRNFWKIQSVNSESDGLIFGIDYRFYLGKLNSRPAPNGIYIGPYYNLYINKATVDFEFVEPASGVGSNVVYEAQFQSKFTMHNVGFQLGYQFIFYKRITLDLVLFGPSISYYILDLSLQSNLSDEKRQEFYDKYMEKLGGKFPFLDKFLALGDFSLSGSTSGLATNFRYMIQIGYHF